MSKAKASSDIAHNEPLPFPTGDETKEELLKLLTNLVNDFNNRDRELTELAAVRKRELEAHEKELVKLRADLEAAHAKNLEEALAKQKRDTLMPIVQKEHERQKAELLAKQRAELEELG